MAAGGRDSTAEVDTSMTMSASSVAGTRFLMRSLVILLLAGRLWGGSGGILGCGRVECQSLVIFGREASPGRG